jgi:hypothetical protein
MHASFQVLAGKGGEVRGGSGTAWQPKPAPSPAVCSVVQVACRSSARSCENAGRTPVYVDSHERDRPIIFHDVW